MNTQWKIFKFDEKNFYNSPKREVATLMHSSVFFFFKNFEVFLHHSAAKKIVNIHWKIFFHDWKTIVTIKKKTCISKHTEITHIFFTEIHNFTRTDIVGS